jgi:MtN3 and saliva related transmembrane protein
MRNLAPLIGIVASCFVITSLLPQMLRVFKLKRAEELSFVWLGIGFTGSALWFIYGLLIGDAIISGSNVLVCASFATLAFQKNYYGRKSMEKDEV